LDADAFRAISVMRRHNIGRLMDNTPAGSIALKCPGKIHQITIY
jgi:hypothetical protein